MSSKKLMQSFEAKPANSSTVKYAKSIMPEGVTLNVKSARTWIIEYDDVDYQSDSRVQCWLDKVVEFLNRRSK